MARRTRRTWVAALLAGVATVAASAVAGDPQEPPQQIGGLAFRDEIELTVVNLVVSVTDRNGRPVTDLTVDDFEVFQDGELKPVTNFQVYTQEVFEQYAEPGPTAVPAPEVTPVPAPGLEPRPVYMVMYIDHYNLNPLDRNRVLNQAQRFIRENVKPPVQMMVVSRMQTPKVLQDFTSESGPVLDALQSIRKDTANRPSRERERSQLIQTMQSREYNPSNLNEPSHVKALIKNFVYEETNDLQFSLGALREITTMLSGLDGKKAILYVSNGLPMIPGIDLFYHYAAAYSDSSALTEAISYDQSRIFESLVAAANAQDITFYTVDAGGLRAAGVANAEYTDSEDMRSATIGRQNYIDSLRFVADGTGGIAIVDTNDVGPWLERVAKDLYTYYSIGYPLSQSGADKVHDIKVRLPNHPEYEARYRRRMVEKSLETRVQEKVITGLMLPLDDNPMELELATDRATPATSDRWMLPLSVTFPARHVALVPEGDDYVGRVVLFVAARDSEGEQSDVVRQDHAFRVPAAAVEEARERRFTIDVSLLMREGSHAVAVGVLDQVTRQASYATTRAAVSPGG